MRVYFYLLSVDAIEFDVDVWFYGMNVDAVFDVDVYSYCVIGGDV